jgi:AraC-like DNA-binding protein
MMRDNGQPVFQKPAEESQARKYEPRGRLDPAGFDRNVNFQVLPPPTGLEPFLEHFWVIRWDLKDGIYRSPEVMHRPYVDVFVSAKESGIQGTFRGRKSYLAAGSGRIVGARFRPGAFHAFWREALASLQDRVLPLKRVFPGADKAFVARVAALEDAEAVAALVELLRASKPKPDRNIGLLNDIIVAIETDDRLQTVEAVAKVFGKSERWIQQFFRDYVGINLKWFLQRHRLLKAAEEIRASDAPDWAGMAYDLGYSSQQHFITDFKNVLGVTPLQYKKDVDCAAG